MNSSHSADPLAPSTIETSGIGTPSMEASTAPDPLGDGGVVSDADEGERLNILGLFVGFVIGLPQLIFPIFAAFFGTRNSDNPMISVIAVCAILFFSLFFRWLSWLRFRYHIGENDIRIESGVVSRNARSIPYDRIQDVSIEQKPLARLFSLGEVKFETGGGDGDDAKLSFVSVEEANRLRELVKAHKAGIARSVDADVALDHEDAQSVFAMDTSRVFKFGLYSFSLIIFAVLGGLAQQFDFLLPFEIWDFRQWIGIAEDSGVTVDNLNGIGWTAQIILAIGALGGLIFVGFATGVIRTLLREHGFRLDRTAKGFRRRRGLLTLTDAVMPAHRVQAAVIQTGPIRKRRGWHSLKFVSLAQDSKDEANFVAAPFATVEEIWPIVNAAMISAPGAETSFYHGQIRHWVTQIIFVVPVILAAMAAVILLADASLLRASLLLLILLIFVPYLWLDWLKYGFALDSGQIYLKRGWWHEKLTIAPQVKVQTVEIYQGPIARRQGLASVNFGISGGSLEVIAIPLATAQAMRDAVMKRVAAVDYSEVVRG